MGGLEFNKIFAAILVAGIAAGLSGFIGKVLVHPHHPKEFAFNVEEMEGGGASAPAKAAMPEPILDMIATADISKGEKVSKVCGACHNFAQGGPNGVGPNLWGVIGGPKDHAAGFAYSGALLEHGGKTWTLAELNKFLWKPKAYAPGTKMSFAGLKKPEDRAALLAWLRQQSSSPVALPSEADIAAEKAELAPAPEEAAPEGAVPAEDAKAATDAATPDVPAASPH